MEENRAEIFELMTPLSSVRDSLVKAVNHFSPLFASTGRMFNSFFVEGGSGLIPFYVNQDGATYTVSCDVSNETFSRGNSISFGIDVPYSLDFIAQQINDLYEKADHFVQENFDAPASEHQRNIQNREIAENHWRDLAEYMRAYLDDNYNYFQYFISADFNFEDFPDIEIYEEISGFEFNYGGLKLTFMYGEHIEPKAGIWCEGKHIHEDNISVMKQKVEMIEQTFKVFTEKVEYYVQLRGLPALV